MTKNTRHFDYADELIKLDEMPKVILVPTQFKRAVDLEMTQRKSIKLNGKQVGYAMPIRPLSQDTETEMPKSKLIEYLFDASVGPCHCGAGKMWEKCCSREDLPRLVKLILGMNVARGSLK